MIRLVEKLPCLKGVKGSVELFKLGEWATLYPDITMFWSQDGGCVIGMLDGNMVIANFNADIDELKEFVNVVSPYSVFSDCETVKKLLGNNVSETYVVQRIAEKFSGIPKSDELSSREIYDLLDTDGLSLPPYPDFAVDLCRRINHGRAAYYGKKDRFAAVSFFNENTALLNGVASHEKGGGTLALRGMLSALGNRKVYAVCLPEISGFYEKNGFEFCYKTAYWVRNK